MRTPALRFTAWFAGLSTTFAQLALIRELSQRFNSNDIFLGWTLAAWVGGTAWGAGALFPKLMRRWPTPGVHWRHRLGSLHLGLLIGVLSLSRALPQLPPWSEASSQTLPSMLFWVLTLTLPLAASGGLWFAALLSGRGATAPATTAFVWEAWGSAAAGLFYTFLLSAHWNPWALTAFLFSAWLVYTSAESRSGRRRVIAGSVLLLCLALTLWPGWARLNQILTPRRLDAGQAWRTGNIRQGTVALYRRQNTYSFYVQNHGQFSFPWPEQNDPTALLTWLWGEPPRTLAVIGAHPDFIRAILEQPGVRRLTLLSPEPDADAWLREQLPAAWANIYTDPRVQIISGDARVFFAAQNSGSFERILVSLPLPETLVLNRFYTRDFMAHLRRHLAPGGILDYILPYSENVRLPAERACFQALWGDLARTFPRTRIWAGTSVHLLGTADTALTFSTPGTWPRQLSSTHLTPAQFPLLFEAERSAALRREWSTDNRHSLSNTDMRPLATGYALGLWLTQQSQATRGILLFAAVGLLLWVFRRWPPSVWRSPLLSMGMAGGLGLSTEWIVLASFQSCRGAIWGALGGLLSAFMAGMAVGAWAAQQKQLRPFTPRAYLLWMAALCALSGFSVYATHGAWGPALFLLGGSGAGIGALFVCLQRKPEAAHAAAYWSADLAGSAASAALTIMVLLPWFGFHAGWILVLLMGLAELGLAVSGRWIRKPVR